MEYDKISRESEFAIFEQLGSVAEEPEIVASRSEAMQYNEILRTYHPDKQELDAIIKDLDAQVPALMRETARFSGTLYYVDEMGSELKTKYVDDVEGVFNGFLHGPIDVEGVGEVNQNILWNNNFS